MLNASGTTIEVTKGDTILVAMNISDRAGNAFTPEAGDQLRFVVKKFLSDPEPLLEVEIPTTGLLLRVEAAQTKMLDAGDYKYDIELTTTDGIVNTIINCGVLKVLEEVD